LPGLVVERVDPAFLTHALADLAHGIVVVTGTNGKTTTTKMLVAILREHGRTVFTNPTGSNFTRGVISSMLAEIPLSGRLEADMAVLELDEAHALKFAAAVKPTHSLLLNVARDQLDRFAEIDHTAKLLAELAERTTIGVVLNIDDSFVSRIAGRVREGVKVTYFGVDPSIADRLPELQEADVRFADGFAPPAPTAADGLLKPTDDRTFEVRFGNSAGGQSAMGALLFHPEFYKAAVANSGCHDNRMDKIWWNEQWMGWPVGPWYEESSNVDNAWRLQGKLLLVVGEMDKNVDPASTLQVADRLIKAGKDAQKFYEDKAESVDAATIKAYKDHGVEIKSLSDQEFDQWIAVAKKSSYAEFAKDVPDGQKLIDEAMSVK